MNSAFVAVDLSPKQDMRKTESAGPPDVTSLVIESTILYRYAKTTVTSRLVNTDEVAREISFGAILPQSAFISAFHIELGGKTHHAYVKEKEEANKEYTAAVSQGRTAAKVDLTARDSNRFTVSVNVEAFANVTFKLTYEELLTRRLGVYSDVINIDPGQIVPELSVLVNIEESYNLTTLRVPSLRVTNELTQEASTSNDPLAIIERPAPNKAVIRWSPSADQQRELRADGVKGQFAVDYDVDRKDNASQILMSDGYFVHFYSPEDLAPLNKHIVFVLDMSGSMGGTKLQQLQEAMRTILSDLRDGDYFTIALFAFTVQVWRPSQVAVEVNIESETELSSDLIVKVNPENIRIAKEFVDNLNANGGTNINDALITSLDIIRVGQKLFNANASKLDQLPRPVPAPMVIFLTDGQANVGQSDTEMIVKGVTQKNTQQASIFSLSFGHDADKDFLKKLSLKNSGFSRLIYEASDAALQLRDFYRQIASPLLANVNFAYEAKQVDEGTLTNVHFSTLFRGSELVVAGKLSAATDQLTGALKGMSITGECCCVFPPPILIQPLLTKGAPSFMEKLWAYLNIQQLLDKQALEDGGNSKSKERALALALKYSFVTPLTSLVVVKPDEVSRVNAEDAGLPSQNNAPMMQQFSACPPMMQQSFAACPPPMAGGMAFGAMAPQMAPPQMMMRSCKMKVSADSIQRRPMPVAMPGIPTPMDLRGPAQGMMDDEQESCGTEESALCSRSSMHAHNVVDGSVNVTDQLLSNLEPNNPSDVANTLWKVTNESGQLTLTKFEEKPLNVDDLSPLFVWIGKTAERAEKIKAIEKAQQFLVNNAYPCKTVGAPQLLRCHVTDTGLLDEIQNYQQHSLDENDVMILDAGEEIYVWIGRKVTDEIRMQTLEVARKYLETGPSAGIKRLALIFIVEHGEEPESFTSMFPSWNRN